MCAFSLSLSLSFTPWSRYATAEELEEKPGSGGQKASLPHWAWATLPNKQNLFVPCVHKHTANKLSQHKKPNYQTTKQSSSN